MKPRDYAVSLLVSLGVCAAVILPSYDRLQGYSLDVLFALRNLVAPPHLDPNRSPVAIVAIDEKTYRTAPFKGVPKVFWTKQMAEVVNALVDAKVGVIGFDLILSTSVERYIKGYDRDFRLALKNGADQGRIVLGSTTLGGQPIEPLDIYRLIVRGNNIRSLNVVKGKDDVVRYVPLFFRPSGGQSADAAASAATEQAANSRLVPSMSLTLASRLLQTPPAIDKNGHAFLGEREIPARRDRHMDVSIDGRKTALANDLLVDLYLGPSSIPTYSLADLYHCAEAGKTDFFRKHFANRAIMIGTVLDVEDRKLTSIRFAQHGPGPTAPETCMPGLEPTAGGRTEAWRRQLIPGIYLHAAAIRNLVRGEVLRPLPDTVSIGLSFALALGMALCVMATTPLRAAVILAAGMNTWIAGATGAFIAGWALPLVSPILASGITLVALVGYRYAVTDRTERHIRKAFGRILAPALVDRMVEMKQMPTQGGELRDITVWLSDLEGYSTISEVLSPGEVVDLLNSVYSVMSDTIEEHGGFVAQFVGDAVVAAFNVPLDDPEHAEHGIEAAMACCDRVAALRDELSLPKGTKLRIRIGVSTGKLLVGYIGSQRRLSYTIVGDDINLASRLEGVNKIYGSTILVNEVTKSLCGPDIVFREIDVVRVKGRDSPVRIFEPVGRREEVDEETVQRMDVFSQALALFRDRKFEEAAALFESLADADPVARSFVGRAREMAEEPPPADWDGVNTLLTK